MSTEKPPDIPRLAHAYRRLVLWVGAQLFLMLAWVVFQSAVQLKLASIDFQPSQPGTPVWIALTIVSLVITVALAYYAYRTADALGSRVPILWVVAMVVPWVNIISLLVLSSRAATMCRKNGIPVGLFGPKLSAKHATTEGGNVLD